MLLQCFPATSAKSLGWVGLLRYAQTLATNSSCHANPFFTDIASIVKQSMPPFDLHNAVILSEAKDLLLYIGDPSSKKTLSG